MKHLKEYKLWEQSRELTPEQEEFLNQYVKGTWRINSEGLVDVEGDFNCSSKKIVSLNGIRFGAVSGNFYCYRNQLTSLEGAPREVGGNFDCWDNQLTSLKGAPREVRGNFYCSENQLTSLEGAPREVGGISIAARISSPLWREHLGKWGGISIATGTQFQMKPWSLSVRK